jgi:predicted dehydrogenase
VTQQLKPEVYPKVDDEATIIVTYPSSQTIIQASWNWPFSRKDMEVYCQRGSLNAKDGKTLLYRKEEKAPESVTSVPERKAPHHDPFSYLKAVIRGEINMKDDDLSALPLNMVVMEILQAAKESAAGRKTVYLKQ